MSFFFFVFFYLPVSSFRLLVSFLATVRHILLKCFHKTATKSDATRIIACVDSALHGLDLLELESGRNDLKEIKAFVAVSATQLDRLDAAKLGSFWQRIETTFLKYLWLIRPLLLLRRYFNGKVYRFIMDKTSSFIDEILFLNHDIERDWHLPMRESMSLGQSSCSAVTNDDVLTIISFNFQFGELFLRSNTLEAEVLAEQMRFFESFSRFVDKPIHDLLVHATADDFHTYILFVFPADLDGELIDKVLACVQKINPIDPLIFGTYTQALVSKKSSGQLLALTHPDIGNDTFVATRNFLDSLISCLWEKLPTNYVVPEKDQLQELYEGLRSLRTILKQQQQQQPPNTLKAEIIIALCNAGGLIFSLYQTHIELDLGLLQDLLKTIKNILVQLGAKDPQLQVFCFPKTNQLGFVDFVLEQLAEHTSREDQPTSNIQSVSAIYKELLFLKSFLGDIVELRHQQEEFQTLWDHVIEVAYKVEILIYQLMVDDHQDPFSTLFVPILKNIMNIKAEIEVKTPEINFQKQKLKLREVTKTHNLLPSQTIPLAVTNEIVGFEDDARSIVDQLTRGSTHLKVVAIVGMPGLGKTTLATKVYNDYSVSYHFPVRAWCPISQTVDKTKVLSSLLNQVEHNNECAKLDEHDLTQKLWRKLKGKRYLIFLDDIWDNEAWNSLVGSFPDDNVESRILLTSRQCDVAPPEILVDQRPCNLRQLNEKESIKLLQRKLFNGNDGLLPTLCKFGVQIAEICQGVPLMIVIVAGLLENTIPERWKEILDDLSFGNLSITENWKRTVERSYEYLPGDLRQCFLYFGAFSEDEEISATKLLYLWSAEGFIRRDKDKRIKDTAEEHLNGLIGRNLIMVTKRRWNGGVKACRIHDLLRDFCLQKANDEHFLHILKGHNDLLAFNEPRGIQRLCIHLTSNHFEESELFCPRVRSLLFHPSYSHSMTMHGFKLLRVLDLRKIHVTDGFLSELELFVHLTFLAIRCSFGHDILSPIAKLSNLETLILHIRNVTSFPLPVGLWNLQKLKYLCLRGRSVTLPIEILDSSSVLYELDRLCGVKIPYCSMKRLLRKFPNVRRLKCTVSQHPGSSEIIDKIVVPEFLSQLESLDLSVESTSYCPLLFELNFPPHVKKLRLRNFQLSWRNMSTIGELLNLQVLILSGISFEGNTWEMREAQFSKLRILKLEDLDSLVSWRACDDQLDRLQELVLSKCRMLEEIPSVLESIPALETIKVSHSSNAAVNLVMKIVEEQKQWDNQVKLIIDGRN